MGYDTTNFRLTRAEVNDVDFLAEMPCYLSNVSEHTFADGNTAFTGSLMGKSNSSYKVVVTEKQISIKDCSLCKWYLGSNLTELDRKDTRQAIEMLSDLLHLPIGKAIITRLDFGININTDYSTIVYLNRLGALNRHNRLQQPTGVCYKQESTEFELYDKIKEQKRAGAYIPELYANKNVLRIEQRYMKRVNERLGNVVGSMLYDEHFNNFVLYRWRDTYNAINKINDFILNFSAMTTIKELSKMCINDTIERAGGLIEALNQIKEAQQMGKLTRKQASDFRKLFNEAAKVDNKIIVPNSAISELDEKVNRAVKFFR